MTKYAPIEASEVREGDVVRGTYACIPAPCVVEGAAKPWGPFDRLVVGPSWVKDLTDLRLISRPTPPEPPLRVGDFVKGRRGHFEGQIVCVTDLADHSPYCVGDYWYESDELRRVEPPVGWPVAVPDPDAPGGVRWYTRTFMGDKYHRHHAAEKKAVFDIGWADLLAAGGVPALAVTR